MEYSHESHCRGVVLKFRNLQLCKKRKFKHKLLCNILCNIIMYLTKNVYCYVHALLPILRCVWDASTPD
jgi:hypothetical protein